MPEFGLRIEGPLDEWIEGLDQFAEDMERESADLWHGAVKAMFDRSQEVVHVQTGELKASGEFEVEVVDGEVVASVEYHAEHAVYEHARGGDHAFLQRAWEDTADEFEDRLEETFDRVVNRWR